MGLMEEWKGQEPSGSLIIPAKRLQVIVVSAGDNTISASLSSTRHLEKVCGLICACECSGVCKHACVCKHLQVCVCMPVGVKVCDLVGGL